MATFAKSKYHEQKFKDLLSSTCQVSVERIVLDLESEVVRDPGSIPTGGNILSLNFFHVVFTELNQFHKTKIAPMITEIFVLIKIVCLK